MLQAGKGQPKFNNATPIFQYGRVDNPKGSTNDDIEGTFPSGSESWANNF